jgi:hypothetical protein
VVPCRRFVPGSQGPITREFGWCSRCCQAVAYHLKDVPKRSDGKAPDDPGLPVQPPMSYTYDWPMRQ